MVIQKENEWKGHSKTVVDPDCEPVASAEADKAKELILMQAGKAIGAPHLSSAKIHWRAAGLAAAVTVDS